MITPGFSRCADCGKGVLLALAVTGDVIAFDAAFGDGPWAIAWDITRTPRCRTVGKSAALRGGEYLYERHALACPKSERVADLAAERLIRRRQAPPRPAAPARRIANAR